MRSSTHSFAAKLLALGLLAALTAIGPATAKPRALEIAPGSAEQQSDAQVPAPSAQQAGPRNVILIIVDGMCRANEAAASRYEHGAEGRLSFQQWPYQTKVTTWDVTCYNRYANGDSETIVADKQWTPDNYNPRLGYDPAQGGTQPQLHVDPATDAYFLHPRFGMGGKGKPPKAGRCATDSASSATAMATGWKTDDGRIAWKPRIEGQDIDDPAVNRLETIAQRARAKNGAAIGVVSTVPFSHATPAAFVAHAKSRDEYQSIADEIVFTTQPDVVLGGGWPGALKDPQKFVSAKAYETLHDDGQAVFIDAQDARRYLDAQAARRRSAGLPNYRVFEQGEQLMWVPGIKLFGLYGNADGLVHKLVADPTWPSGYREEVPGNPTLPDMAMVALEQLSTSPQGFFLMLEQGDVDWGNHAGDFAWSIGAMHDADVTAQWVLRWIAQPDDSVTLDNTLVLLVPDHAHYIRLAADYDYGRLELPPGVPGKLVDIPGDEFKRKQTAGGAVVYSTPLTHSNELVTLYAIGGSEAQRAALFAQYEGREYHGVPGMERVINNTDIYKVMRDWLGL